jgi:HAE1 family hydrophobic/amphiphilic exporter-1
MKLAEISIKRPSLVIVLFTILTLGGLQLQIRLWVDPKIWNQRDFDCNLSRSITQWGRKYRYQRLKMFVLKTSKKIDSKSFESLSSVSITLTSNADVNISMNDAQYKRHHKWLTRWRSGAFTEQVFVERFTIMTIGANGKWTKLFTT